MNTNTNTNADKSNKNTNTNLARIQTQTHQSIFSKTSNNPKNTNTNPKRSTTQSPKLSDGKSKRSRTFIVKLKQLCNTRIKGRFDSQSSSIGAYLLWKWTRKMQQRKRHRCRCRASSLSPSLLPPPPPLNNLTSPSSFPSISIVSKRFWFSLSLSLCFCFVVWENFDTKTCRSRSFFESMRSGSGGKCKRWLLEATEHSLPHLVHCLLFKKYGGWVLGFNVSLVIEEVWVMAFGI